MGTRGRWRGAQRRGPPLRSMPSPAGKIPWSFTFSPPFPVKHANGRMGLCLQLRREQGRSLGEGPGGGVLGRPGTHSPSSGSPGAVACAHPA